MIALEKYLIEQGFEKFVMNTKTMQLEKAKGYVISSMVNLDHRYVKDDIQVIIGLNEKDRPVTLIYPRLGFDSDDEMNRYLWENEPSEVLKKILQ